METTPDKETIEAQGAIAKLVLDLYFPQRPDGSEPTAQRMTMDFATSLIEQAARDPKIMAVASEVRTALNCVDIKDEQGEDSSEAGEAYVEARMRLFNLLIESSPELKDYYGR